MQKDVRIDHPKAFDNLQQRYLLDRLAKLFRKYVRISHMDRKEIDSHLPESKTGA